MRHDAAFCASFITKTLYPEIYFEREIMGSYIRSVRHGSRQTPKGEAGGSIPFWRAKNPGNRLISGIFIDNAKYNAHRKDPDVELQKAAARQGP